jgi:thiopurine S-methyltransferase
MDHGFWLRRWEDGEIAFHEGDANRFLTRHCGRLALSEGSRVLLPLCGKTRDIAWLLSQGLRVVGVELSRLAVDRLFSELRVEPRIDGPGAVASGWLRYHARDVEVLVGDMFALPRTLLGRVDAVFDRAALVALPSETRTRYTRLLTELTDGAQQLLVTYRYDQSLMEGPPFSVSRAELRQHYSERYDVTPVDRQEVPGGLKGTRPVWEEAWSLKPR